MEISKTLDAEFQKDLPDLATVKLLGKRLQQLQHSYNGVLILESKYDFECRAKWLFESDKKQ